MNPDQEPMNLKIRKLYAYPNHMLSVSARCLKVKFDTIPQPLQQQQQQTQW